MRADEPIRLTRDCEAVLVPSGEKVRLAAGSQVWVTRSLGDSYTVMTDHGYMARISGKDGDALGMESPGLVTSGAASGRSGNLEQRVWDELRNCFDPEIAVNIVDLGLVYLCRVTPHEAGGSRVEVKFTLTARGCGMGEILKEEIRNRILSVPGIREVQVELVWDPPWNQSMISQAAKIELGIV